MSTRVVTFIFFILTLLGWGLSQVLGHSTELGLCLSEDPGCINFLTRIGDPLYYGMFALSIVFALLTIFPIAVRAWKQFALWFLPLAIELFIFYKGGTYDPYPEQVFQWMSGFYIVVSTAIIVISVVRNRTGQVGPQKYVSRRKEIIYWTIWSLYILLLVAPHLYDLIWYLTA